MTVLPQVNMKKVRPGFTQCLKNSQLDVTYIPAHTVQIAFPEDVAQLEQYDAIVISDIGSNTSCYKMILFISFA